MDSDPFDLIGDVVDGQFRVDAFVAEGDLSVVYKGHHLGLDAPVAIKCLNLPATLDRALVQPMLDSFAEAGRVHYRLARRNLNIAQSIASGTTLAPRTGALVPYLVREWFEGESLASELARRRSEKRAGRSPEEAIALLGPVFDGVAFAHSQGVAHLSLNPSNLFLAAHGQGEGASLKVLDFGVARTISDLVSGIPASAGSTAGLRLLFPAYAAPEQLDKKVGTLGPWTDVYALALLMMELLSGRVVMSETDTGALVEHALDGKRRPTPQAHGLKLPRALEQALSRAVSMAPDRRQKNAEQLWKEIRVDPRGRSAPSSQRLSLPTLLGMTAPAPRVAGALAAAPKAALSAPSAETKPMAFEAAAPPERGRAPTPSSTRVLAPCAAPPPLDAALSNDNPALGIRPPPPPLRSASVPARAAATPLAPVLPPAPALSGVS
ncbi:MAG TPA: protein kinase, partial [Polyangiaceae bacterium]|nr:protein kinase [Polyangiaceae bacterium]